MIGWVFFKADTLTDALLYLKQMFIPVSKPNILGDINYFLSKELLITLLIGIVISTPIFGLIKSRLKNLKQELPIKQMYFGFLILLFHISLSYIAIDSYNPFIYFRF